MGVPTRLVSMLGRIGARGMYEAGISGLVPDARVELI